MTMPNPTAAMRELADKLAADVWADSFEKKRLADRVAKTLATVAHEATMAERERCVEIARNLPSLVGPEIAAAKRDPTPVG